VVHGNRETLNPAIIFRAFLLRALLIAAAGIGLCASQAAAQQSTEPALQGYITSVHWPSGFDVNGEHVAVTDDTGFGSIGNNTIRNDGPIRDRTQIGAWVEVFGDENSRKKTVTAKAVYLRDDWDRKREGLGVVIKIIATQPDLIFAADGYRIRVTPSTEISSPEDVKSAAGVHANLWVRYEGKLDKGGVLVATRALFLPPKSSKVKAVKGIEEINWKFQAPASSLSGGTAKGDAQLPYDVSDQQVVLTKDGSVKFGPVSRTYKVPADQALQARVQRVGRSLIPAYQKQLAANDPSKISFRFYAFDDAKGRNEYCSFEGLVLIPSQIVARLKSDDQLAAQLADCMASDLQRQGSKIVESNRAILGAEAAGLTVGALIPGAGLPILIGDDAAAHKLQVELEEQRGRIALQLVADAGYDPWQAPESERLAVEMKPPKDPNAAVYPDIAGYELSILNLTYKKPPASSISSTAADSANAKP
jgi:hypothetical protein